MTKPNLFSLHFVSIRGRLIKDLLNSQFDDSKYYSVVAHITMARQRNKKVVIKDSCINGRLLREKLLIVIDRHLFYDIYLHVDEIIDNEMEITVSRMSRRRLLSDSFFQ